MGKGYAPIDVTGRMSSDIGDEPLRNSIDNITTCQGPCYETSPQQQLFERRNAMVAIVTLFFVSATITLVLIATIIQRSDEGRVWQYNCGTTIAEAMDLRCEFDVVSYSWTPRPCLDAEPSEEFLEWLQKEDRALGPFPFFADPNGTKRIRDVHELSQYAGSVAYATQEEHLAHCIFWMRRMERTRLGLARQLMRGLGIQHAMHCTMSLLDSLGGYNASVVVQPHAVLEVGYNKC